MKKKEKIRFGLCCLFMKENIKFRTTTFKHISKLTPLEKIKKLNMLILHNMTSLLKAIKYCIE